jgi:hypothetical protein
MSGLEPLTLRLQSACSAKLSYTGKWGEKTSPANSTQPPFPYALAGYGCSVERLPAIRPGLATRRQGANNAPWLSRGALTFRQSGNAYSVVGREGFEPPKS